MASESSPLSTRGNIQKQVYFAFWVKNDIRDVRSTADLVLVFLVQLVHWYQEIS